MMMLPNILLQTLTTATNKILTLDSFYQTRLTKLEGKNILLIMKPFTFYLSFSDKHIQFLEQAPDTIDTQIETKPLGLIKLSLLPQEKLNTLFQQEVSIKGDVALGNELKKLFSQLHIDWEAHLSHYTGDIIAHQIANVTRGGVDCTKHFKQTMQQNMTEFMQEEAALLPPKEALLDFFDAIDELQLRIDRLETKLNMMVTSNE